MHTLLKRMILVVWVWNVGAAPRIAFDPEAIEEKIGPLDNTLSPEAIRLDQEWREFGKHNVSTIQVETATRHGEDLHLVSLTDAQVDAITAADQSPTNDNSMRYLPGTTFTPVKYEDMQLPAEKEHLAHIYKVMKAKFSRDQIYSLFHSSDGKPIRLSDKAVDDAIAAHKKLVTAQRKKSRKGRSKKKAKHSKCFDSYARYYLDHDLNYSVPPCPEIRIPDNA